MSIPYRFFVASRYATLTGELLSERTFYTIVPPVHYGDPEGWAHRFYEGYARLPEDVYLVVREVSRSAFNELNMLLPA